MCGLLLFSLLLLVPNSLAFINYYGKIEARPITGDPGQPLILTDLIRAGKVKEAQAAARVDFEQFGNVASYSGYLTVNERFGSNVFFWYFPAETNVDAAPVVLWLQGGPGASSLYGLFEENGPFAVDDKGNAVKARKYSWSRNHHVVYIDNPVGKLLSIVRLT